MRALDDHELDHAATECTPIGGARGAQPGPHSPTSTSRSGRGAPRVRAGDDQATFLTRGLRVWVLLLTVVVLVVVVYLIIITNTLASINGNLATADRALQVLPTMLGRDEPKNWLLVFQNNAEVRATGGLPGAISVVTADDGELSRNRQAISPRHCNTTSGTGNSAGRCNSRASSAVNSALRSGVGAVRLNTPCKVWRSIRKWIAAHRSSR